MNRSISPNDCMFKLTNILLALYYIILNNALYNSNTCIGYKLAFYRYTCMFNIDMDSNINSSISRLSICSMNDNQTAIVNNLKTLISVKGRSQVINGFTTNKINDLVDQLSVI